jgi:hypothetical protein
VSPRRYGHPWRAVPTRPWATIWTGSRLPGSHPFGSPVVCPVPSQTGGIQPVHRPSATDSARRDSAWASRWSSSPIDRASLSAQSVHGSAVAADQGRILRRGSSGSAERDAVNQLAASRRGRSTHQRAAPSGPIATSCWWGRRWREPPTSRRAPRPASRTGIHGSCVPAGRRAASCSRPRARAPLASSPRPPST